MEKHSDPFEIMYMVSVHFIPGISTIIQYMTLDVRMKAGHCKPYFVIAIFYGVVNYIATQIHGKPIYDWLDW